ncbi:MAG TPA: XdhC family protein, partial [Mycobacteriales bacterium]|nr:XdhC family protein [Mycobacteriales bacterium]
GTGMGRVADRAHDGFGCMTDLLDEAARLRAARQPYVLATVVWRRAPTSGTPGAKAIVHPDGSVDGWVGGACAQPTLIRQAREALHDGAPRLVYLGPTDGLDGVLRDGVVRVPMACESEGALEIFLEPVLPAPHVLVVGDSDLTDCLATLAAAVGWSVTVTDSSDFAAGDVTIDQGAAVVVATQGRWDEEAVQTALGTAAGYVGLVASARRAAAVTEWLRGADVAEAALARLHAPAGLDLGSVGHQEIAVAIMAELVALRAAGGLHASASLEPVIVQQREVLDAVCGMTVDLVTARHVSEWRGDRFAFCAASCKRAFDDDPEKYAGAATSQ